MQGIEVYMDECKFQIYPNLVNVTYDNATIGASLVEDGMIYAVITTGSSQPFAFQVYLGLDSTNKPLENLNIAVLSGIEVNLFFGNLLANTTYNAFLICANNYPGYPDLLSDANLVMLTFNTLPNPILPSLQINSSKKLSQVFVILFIIGLI